MALCGRALSLSASAGSLYSTADAGVLDDRTLSEVRKQPCSTSLIEMCRLFWRDLSMRTDVS